MEEKSHECFPSAIHTTSPANTALNLFCPHISHYYHQTHTFWSAWRWSFYYYKKIYLYLFITPCTLLTLLLNILCSFVLIPTIIFKFWVHSFHYNTNIAILTTAWNYENHGNNLNYKARNVCTYVCMYVCPSDIFRIVYPIYFTLGGCIEDPRKCSVTVNATHSVLIQLTSALFSSRGQASVLCSLGRSISARANLAIKHIDLF